MIHDRYTIDPRHVATFLGFLGTHKRVALSQPPMQQLCCVLAVVP